MTTFEIFVAIPSNKYNYNIKVLENIREFQNDGKKRAPPGRMTINFALAEHEALIPGHLNVWFDKRAIAYKILELGSAKVTVSREADPSTFKLSSAKAPQAWQQADGSSPSFTPTTPSSGVSSLSLSSLSISSSSSSAGKEDSRSRRFGLESSSFPTGPFMAPQASNSVEDPAAESTVLRCSFSLKLSEGKSTYKAITIYYFHSMNAIFRELGSSVRQRLLRVSFKCDDKYDDGQLEKLAELSKAVMTQGIRIGDRYYDFALTSASSMRENSAWFFSRQERDAIPDAKALQRRLGDFSKIPPRKLASRLAQAFSSTIGGITIEDTRVIGVCDDLIRNGFNFSDGIGRISPEYACKLSVALGLMQPGECPQPSVWDSDAVARRNIRLLTRTEKLRSAFQIRMGGAKGMVVLDPNLPVNGKHIMLRPSMIKFPSSLRRLEICKYSKRVNGRLNIEIVRILDHLKVPHQVFLEQATAELEEAQMMLVDPLSVISYLRSEGEHEFFHSESLMMLGGFSPAKDPLVSSMINKVYNSRVKSVSSCRLPVKSSRVAFGVVDELRVLGPDEIYFAWSGDGNPTVLDGQKVFVAKNPCKHPGDIRVLRARNVPDLSHLVDVIVFPQTGDRPLCDQIAGSDLDGDQYLVCWDAEFIPPAQPETAADYGSKKDRFPSAEETYPFQMTTQIQDIEPAIIATVIDCFAEHMIASPILAAISTRHDTWAALPGGVNRFECRELAKLFSAAVDAPKTGKYLSRNDPALIKLAPKPPSPAVNVVEKIKDLVVQVQQQNARHDVDADDIDELIRPYSNEEAWRLEQLYDASKKKMQESGKFLLQSVSEDDFRKLKWVELFHDLMQFWNENWRIYFEASPVLDKTGREGMKKQNETGSHFKQWIVGEMTKMFYSRAGDDENSRSSAAKAVYLHEFLYRHHPSRSHYDKGKHNRFSEILVYELTKARNSAVQDLAVRNLRQEPGKKDNLATASISPSITIDGEIFRRLKLFYKGPL